MRGESHPRFNKPDRKLPDSQAANTEDDDIGLEYAPPPVHPEDIPFDPEMDKKWRKDRGLPERDYGDQDSDRKPGNEDPTIVDYTV